MTVYYKWLLPNYVTAVQKKTWPVAVGEWTLKERPVLCKSGWHGVEEKHVLSHLPHTMGAELWEVEVKGEVVHGEDKFVAEQMRLLWRVGVTTEANLRLFMCDVAQDVLPIYEAWAPNDDRPRRSIDAGRAYALDSTNEKRAAWAAWAAEAARAAEQYSNWLVVRIESGF